MGHTCVSELVHYWFIWRLVTYSAEKNITWINLGILLHAAWQQMSGKFESRYNNKITLLWRHNERDSVSNHHHLRCLLNRLFRRRSKITSKLRVAGLCAWNSPVIGQFPAQRASNAENDPIWWRHHGNSNPLRNIRKSVSVTTCWTFSIYSSYFVMKGL